MKKALLLLAIAVLCLGTFASADNLVKLSTRTSTNPTDIFDWTQLGPDFLISGQILSTPQLVFSSGGTNAALVGNTNGGGFLRVDSGISWSGNFDFGESLVWTGNANFGIGGGGPFAIELANPVSTFGFGIQADLFGPFNVQVQVFNPSLNPIGTLDFSGNSFLSFAGDNLFVGIGDRSGVNIGAVIISTVSVNDKTGTFTNDFAIDDPSFGYGSVTPEPSSLTLLGSGLLGMAAVVRRKLGR